MADQVKEVVSYLKTTSNHNNTRRASSRSGVVSYLKTTSNHNSVVSPVRVMKCCILFKNYIKPQLRDIAVSAQRRCILFKNYIKPQRCTGQGARPRGCILFKNYIKPQHLADARVGESVVSYLKTTSNHNPRP